MQTQNKSDFCKAFSIIFCFFIFGSFSAFAFSNSIIQNTPENMPETADTNVWKLFVGTYTDSGSEGIYVFSFHPANDTLQQLSSKLTENPSYLAIHPNKKWIYAVNEHNNGKVSAFLFDSLKNELSHINSVSANGNNPCYISIDNTGSFVLIANYSSGNVVTYAIEQNGKLSEALSVNQHSGSSVNTNRQNEPHAHMVSQAVINNYVYASDLGIDKLVLYQLGSQGALQHLNQNININAGAGPRHFAEHKMLKTLYVLGELNGTIEVFKLSETNAEAEKIQQISTVAENDTRFPGAADIHISPNGKFLYASNRGNINTIAIYSINQLTGTLNLTGFESVNGRGPRNFAISPDGKFLLVANQDSNNIVVFCIDAITGSLKPAGYEVNIPKPVCIKFW